MSNAKTITDCLAVAGELYGKSVSEAALRVWYRALREHSTEAIQRAFDAHFTRGDPFMPKPSDIVRLIEGTSTDKAMTAWAKVEDAMRSHGAYKSVVFDDPLIHHCVEQMGGWVTLCATKISDTPFRANDFRKHYDAALRDPPATWLPQLTGITEANNRREGFLQFIDEPKLIGDADQARLTYQRGSVPTADVARLGDALPRIGKPDEAA